MGISLHRSPCEAAGNLESGMGLIPGTSKMNEGGL